MNAGASLQRQVWDVYDVVKTLRDALFQDVSRCMASSDGRGSGGASGSAPTPLGAGRERPRPSVLTSPDEEPKAPPASPVLGQSTLSYLQSQSYPLVGTSCPTLCEPVAYSEKKSVCRGTLIQTSSLTVATLTNRFPDGLVDALAEATDMVVQLDRTIFRALQDRARATPLDRFRGVTDPANAWETYRSALLVPPAVEDATGCGNSISRREVSSRQSDSPRGDTLTNKTLFVAFQRLLQGWRQDESTDSAGAHEIGASGGASDTAERERLEELQTLYTLLRQLRVDGPSSSISTVLAAEMVAQLIEIVEILNAYACKVIVPSLHALNQALIEVNNALAGVAVSPKDEMDSASGFAALCRLDVVPPTLAKDTFLVKAREQPLPAAPSLASALEIVSGAAVTTSTPFGCSSTIRDADGAHLESVSATPDTAARVRRKQRTLTGLLPEEEASYQALRIESDMRMERVLNLGCNELQCDGSGAAGDQPVARRTIVLDRRIGSFPKPVISDVDRAHLDALEALCIEEHVLRQLLDRYASTHDPATSSLREPAGACVRAGPQENCSKVTTKLADALRLLKESLVAHGAVLSEQLDRVKSFESRCSCWLLPLKRFYVRIEHPEPPPPPAALEMSTRVFRSGSDERKSDSPSDEVTVTGKRQESDMWEGAFPRRRSEDSEASTNDNNSDFLGGCRLKWKWRSSTTSGAEYKAEYMRAFLTDYRRWRKVQSISDGTMLHPCTSLTAVATGSSWGDHGQSGMSDASDFTSPVFTRAALAVHRGSMESIESPQAKSHTFSHLGDDSQGSMRTSLPLSEASYYEPEAEIVVNSILLKTGKQPVEDADSESDDLMDELIGVCDLCFRDALERSLHHIRSPKSVRAPGEVEVSRETLFGDWRMLVFQTVLTRLALCHWRAAAVLDSVFAVEAPLSQLIMDHLGTEHSPDAGLRSSNDAGVRLGNGCNISPAEQLLLLRHPKHRTAYQSYAPDLQSSDSTAVVQSLRDVAENEALRLILMLYGFLALLHPSQSEGVAQDDAHPSGTLAVPFVFQSRTARVREGSSGSGSSARRRRTRSRGLKREDVAWNAFLDALWFHQDPKGLAQGGYDDKPDEVCRPFTHRFLSIVHIDLTTSSSGPAVNICATLHYATHLCGARLPAQSIRSILVASDDIARSLVRSGTPTDCLHGGAADLSVVVRYICVRRLLRTLAQIEESHLWHLQNLFQCPFGDEPLPHLSELAYVFPRHLGDDGGRHPIEEASTAPSDKGTPVSVELSVLQASLALLGKSEKGAPECSNFSSAYCEGLPPMSVPEGGHGDDFFIGILPPPAAHLHAHRCGQCENGLARVQPSDCASGNPAKPVPLTVGLQIAELLTEAATACSPHIPPLFEAGNTVRKAYEGQILRELMHRVPHPSMTLQGHKWIVAPVLEQVESQLSQVWPGVDAAAVQRAERDCLPVGDYPATEQFGVATVVGGAGQEQDDEGVAPATLHSRLRGRTSNSGTAPINAPTASGAPHTDVEEIPLPCQEQAAPSSRPRTQVTSRRSAMQKINRVPPEATVSSRLSPRHSGTRLRSAPSPWSASPSTARSAAIAAGSTSTGTPECSRPSPSSSALSNGAPLASSARSSLLSGSLNSRPQQRRVRRQLSFGVTADTSDTKQTTTHAASPSPSTSRSRAQRLSSSAEPLPLGDRCNTPPLRRSYPPHDRADFSFTVPISTLQSARLLRTPRTKREASMCELMLGLSGSCKAASRNDAHAVATGPRHRASLKPLWPQTDSVFPGEPTAIGEMHAAGRTGFWTARPAATESPCATARDLRRSHSCTALGHRPATASRRRRPDVPVLRRRGN